MTDTQFIIAFVIGWISCWIYMKVMEEARNG